MRRTLAALTIGCLAGLAAGHLLFSPGPADPAPSAPAQEPRPSPEPACPSAPSAPAAMPAPTAKAVEPAPGAGPAEPHGKEPEEQAALRERIVRLQQELAEQQRLLEDHEGTSFRAPESLPARFSETPLRVAVDAALEEAGFPEAQVTSVDCTEYPCIVYAEGIGGRDEATSLLEAGSLAAYADDHRLSSCNTFTPAPGAPEKRFCGFAFLPKDGSSPDRVAVGKRMRFRVEQMLDAIK